MNVLDKTYSQELDSKDSLAKYRKDFHIPVFSGKQALYFTGNSLGLMPKLAEKYMTEELEDWKKWVWKGTSMREGLGCHTMNFSLKVLLK
jgi:kynureninase